MSFKDKVKFYAHITAEPRVFDNSRYDLWLNLYLDDPNDPRIPKNIKARIEAYLQLRGTGPYPEPKDIEDWPSTWWKESKFFVDRFAKYGQSADFNIDFSDDFN